MFIGRQVKQNTEGDLQQYMNNEVIDISTLKIVLYLA